MREDTLVTTRRSERMDATCITRRFPWCEVVYYVFAQMIGALLGTLTLRLLIGDIAALGINLLSGSARQSFGLEVLLTTVLMFVIISVATDTSGCTYLPP
jgi:glycerol uptake facilitator-like aquaporin